jgi:Cd2+/Zn2+-exporting ATPase
VAIALALALIPPLVIPGATFATWLYRALIFLVVSCPCALVISIPLGFFGGIGGAARHGVLFKGGNYLEALNHVDTIVFDKTGTLTQGVFEVTAVHNTGLLSDEQILELAAHAESHSSHPIGQSIIRAYARPVDTNRIQDYREVNGQGIVATYDGLVIQVGSLRLLADSGIDVDGATTDESGSVVHLAVDGRYAGSIVISDKVRPDARQAIQDLRTLGVRKLVMLTGDSWAVGRRIGRELGLDQVYAELLPDQKVEQLEKLEMERDQAGLKSKLVFVGDGVNDAPVLSRADIGIAMGGLGSDAAIEASDIVIMTDEPAKIASAIRIARHTRMIVMQNIVFALVIKGAVLLMGAAGLATMWAAVFADIGVALIAIFNALRVLHIKNRALTN